MSSHAQRHLELGVYRACQHWECFSEWAAVEQVVYEWARGTPFKDICALTDVMEGSIVRAMVSENPHPMRMTRCRFIVAAPVKETSG